VIENRGDPCALIDAWSGAARVFLVDALSAAVRPGALYILDGLAPLLEEKPFRCSTHGQSILTAIELARALNCLPPQLTILAVEGKTFDHGAALSEEARSGAEQALRMILQHSGSDFYTKCAKLRNEDKNHGA
jgi:hydrogenase maturation protease